LSSNEIFTKTLLNMIVSQETHTCSKYKKAIIELSQETNTRSKYEKGSFL
jgi:hypothetical protein